MTETSTRQCHGCGQSYTSPGRNTNPLADHRCAAPRVTEVVATDTAKPEAVGQAESISAAR